VPDYSVIADVSDTLRAVLTGGFTTLGGAQPPIAELHDLTGQISTNPPRLTVFLFDVCEDASQRNRRPLQSLLPPNLSLQKPPMALLLRYLMTPWSGDRLTDHRILGRTLQILYDDAIISGPQLQGGLVGTSEALKIKLTTLELEDRARVWHAVQRPFRLSLTYEVRVANLDSETREMRPAISSRQMDPARVSVAP
jgi:hypothetical protein